MRDADASKKRNGVAYHERSPCPTAIAGSSPAGRRSATRVLLVEDDHLTRQSLDILLSDAGFAVFTAPSAKEALAAGPVEAVVTDLHLPGPTDGAALIAAMRRARPEIAAVLLTGDFSAHPVPGAVLLFKPFEIETLVAAIKDALAFDGPAIVDIDVDPNEPPLPGKVAYDQATKLATAFLKGQPHKAAIATTLFKDKIEQLKR